MKQRLLLVRHGQSVGNVDHAFYAEIPDYAITLTDKGKQQAFERGLELAKLDGDFVVFVSTHHRARQTLYQIAKSIGNRIIKVIQSPLIREQEWSNAVGTGADMELERERLKWGVFHYRFPGGESCADVHTRMSLFNAHKLMTEVESRLTKNFLVVGHGMGMRIQSMALLDMPVDEFELLRNPKNCGQIEFEMEDGYIRHVEGLAFRENRSHIFEFSEEKTYELGEMVPVIHEDWGKEFA